MMTTRTWSLFSDLDGVGTAMITSRVMSVPSSAHPRRVVNPSRSPRQADFADPLGGILTTATVGCHDDDDESQERSREDDALSCRAAAGPCGTPSWPWPAPWGHHPGTR